MDGPSRNGAFSTVPMWARISGLAAVLAAVSLVSIAHNSHHALGRDPLGIIAVLAAACAALALLRWSAPLAFAVTLAGAAALIRIAGGDGPACLIPLIPLAFCVAALPVAGGIILAIAGAVLLTAVSGFTEITVSFAVIWLLSGLFAGTLIRNRRRFVAQEAERAALEERNRQTEMRTAVADERVRIARDLHDIVGHSLAVIALQAGVADHVFESSPKAAKAAISSIRTVSKRSLSELRWELAALRGESPHDGDDVASLAGIPALVESIRSAGIEVEYSSEGEAGDIPEVIGAACYRIVQESFTNVVKHGGRGCTAKLSLTLSDDGITLLLENTVPSGENIPQENGAGIRGMTERAQALGGTLSAGRTEQGAFRVTARLPGREP